MWGKMNLKKYDKKRTKPDKKTSNLYEFLYLYIM